MSDIIIPPDEVPSDPAPVPDVPNWIVTDRGMMDQNKLMRSTSVLYAGDVALSEIETWRDDTGATVRRDERAGIHPKAII